jgi:hypothetical protein
MEEAETAEIAHDVLRIKKRLGCIAAEIVK